jgi:hypothetical protein
MWPLLLAVLAVVHDSDLLPLAAVLQLLAAGHFACARDWVAATRAQCHQRYNYMVQCFECAIVSGVFCPCMNQSVKGILRMESLDRAPFDQRLARVLGCSLWALNPYDTGDPYPVQLVQRFQEFNPFLVWLLSLQSHYGDWPLALWRSSGSRGLSSQVRLQEHPGGLDFEVLSKSGVVALD